MVDGISEAVGEKGKDFMDCIRFIVQTNPKYITHEDEQLPQTHYRMPTDSGY
jgi:hypothetical protein